MYGLQAISASNGWQISFLGVSIVFTGLILLSLAIGQIYKLLALWDNRKNLTLLTRRQPAAAARPPVPGLNGSQKIAATQFRTLASTLGDPFSLPKLLALAEVSGLDRPHTSLNTLLENGIITPDSNGFFVWNQDRFTQLVS